MLGLSSAGGGCGLGNGIITAEGVHYHCRGCGLSITTAEGVVFPLSLQGVWSFLVANWPAIPNS